MAADNTPISQLPKASTLIGSEPIPTVQGDETSTPSTVTTLYTEKTTVQTTPAQIAEYVNNNLRSATIPPAGTVAMFAGAAAPIGWLICDGQSLQDAAQYGKLYDAIGIKYGGTGKNNFKIPDMQGKVVVGPNSALLVGAVGGAATHKLTVNELPSHSHDFLDGTFTLNDGRGSDGGVDGDKHGVHKFKTDVTGGSKPFSIMQPYLVMNYIIKY